MAASYDGFLVGRASVLDWNGEAGSTRSIGSQLTVVGRFEQTFSNGALWWNLLVDFGTRLQITGKAPVMMRAVSGCKIDTRGGGGQDGPPSQVLVCNLYRPHHVHFDLQLCCEKAPPIMSGSDTSEAPCDPLASHQRPNTRSPLRSTCKCFSPSASPTQTP